MAIWRHLVMVRDNDYGIKIFPARRVNLEGLFQQFPKIKKSKHSTASSLIIETGSEAMQEMVEEAIINYLEENGWEGYAYTVNWNTFAFKRLEG